MVHKNEGFALYCFSFIFIFIFKKSHLTCETQFFPCGVRMGGNIHMGVDDKQVFFYMRHYNNGVTLMKSQNRSVFSHTLSIGCLIMTNIQKVQFCCCRMIMYIARPSLYILVNGSEPTLLHNWHDFSLLYTRK